MELLHEYGIDKNGNLVRASLAIKGEEYFCPGCKDNFILKNSGKTGKGSRRPHFAHKNLEGNCSHESYLHNTFKMKTLEILKEHISRNIPFTITWECRYCSQIHPLNLTGGIFNVFAEYDMKERRPDIALLDQNNNVVAVIEIVYKHAPENNAIKFYKDNDIILIQTILKSDNDLEDIQGTLQNCSNIDYCPIKTMLRIQQLMSNKRKTTKNFIRRRF